MRRKFKPLPQQKVMIDFLLDNARCGLWAGMGLGKTASVLTALDILFWLGERKPPVLIIAPLRVAETTWPDEVAKWDHLKNMVIQPIIGNAQKRKAALKNSRAHIFTINYENIPWLVKLLGRKWPFRIVVGDEATKLKSYRSKQGGVRTRMLSTVAWSQVDVFWELTGTPSPNGYADLWGQIYFLDGGARLGRSYAAYKTRWFNEDREHFRLDIRPGASEEIENKLKDICVSLNAADYFDLKDPIPVPRYITLPPKARARYDEMEEEMFTELENYFKHRHDGKSEVARNFEVEAVNAAARTMKCLQLANGAAYVEEDNKEWVEIHDQKIQALDEIIEEAAGMPVLVAYHFKSDLARLKKAFPQGRQLDKKPQTIKDWNKGRIPILFAHPASAGHGLNLQDGGNIIAFFGHDWNLENYLQIIERIGPVRQMQSGYNRPVFIYHIIAKDTAEELVMARLEGKKSVQEILMQALKHHNKG